MIAQCNNNRFALSKLTTLNSICEAVEEVGGTEKLVSNIGCTPSVISHFINRIKSKSQQQQQSKHEEDATPTSPPIRANLSRCKRSVR